MSMVRKCIGYSTLELCVGFLFVLMLLVGVLEIATWMRARGAVKIAVHEAIKEYSRSAGLIDALKTREARSKERAMNALKVFFPQLNSYCSDEHRSFPCLDISFEETLPGNTGRTRREVMSTVSIMVERRIFNVLGSSLDPSWSTFKASSTEVRSLEEDQYSQKENFNSVHSTN